MLIKKMKMKTLLCIWMFAAQVCIADNVFGQKNIIDSPTDTSKIYKIELLDGSIFIGNILHQDSINLFIKTASIPKIEVPIARIKSIVEIAESNFKDGNYWFPNPHSTRYFYGPSAIGLKKGEGYYQNTLLLLNSFNVGVTDNISIGGGLELISTFALRDPLFFITPKISFKVTEHFHAGGGVLYARTPLGLSSIGTTFATGTYGSLNHNVTGSLGWGFVSGEFNNKPIVTLSGMTRVSKRVALVTENWLIPSDDYYGIFSYGLRFIGEKIAVDLAFINNPDIADFILIGIPYASFTVKFGK
jgi:hypothetical protein